MSDTDHVRRIKRDASALAERIESHPLLGRIVRGEATRAEYVRFLVATYHYVRWSGVLLARTAEGLARRRRDDALVALLHEKSEEEAPHDRWVLEDLRQLGVNVELAKGELPAVAVLGYVHANLAYAAAGSAAFLGAAYALEFLSMRRATEAARNLRARAAIPNIDGAVSFLERHGSADHGHVATLETYLLDLSDPLEREAVATGAASLCLLFPLFFEHPETRGGTAFARDAA